MCIRDRTTTEELEAAVIDFHPHVVHFICHGGLDTNGVAQIHLTKGELRDKQLKKTIGDDPCNAARLVELLRQPKSPRRMLAIIVLRPPRTTHVRPSAGACYT